jgi:hypothetical protein
MSIKLFNTRWEFYSCKSKASGIVTINFRKVL